MVRLLLRVLPVLLALVIGAVGAFLWTRPTAAPLPETPALVTRVREVARLETLSVSLYKKVEFSPEPRGTDSLWKDVINWASYSRNPPRGRAIVFADVHLGYDFGRMDDSTLRVQGTRVDVALPPLEVKVELKPADTEIIGSNLDSAQTTLLLEKAREAFEREVKGDARLRARARASAENTLRVLFLSLGFREVNVVDVLPPRATAGGRRHTGSGAPSPSRNRPGIPSPAGLSPASNATAAASASRHTNANSRQPRWTRQGPSPTSATSRRRCPSVSRRAPSCPSPPATAHTPEPFGASTTRPSSTPTGRTGAGASSRWRQAHSSTRAGDRPAGGGSAAARGRGAGGARPPPGARRTRAAARAAPGAPAHPLLQEREPTAPGAAPRSRPRRPPTPARPRDRRRRASPPPPGPPHPRRASPTGAGPAAGTPPRRGAARPAARR